MPVFSRECERILRKEEKASLGGQFTPSRLFLRAVILPGKAHEWPA